ncbi:hypothetical protein C2R22_16820 [Salinigranum rubrum]|uniref:HTTM domain-containing protein n=1 Tax=Salinigranum rubrum TaxID=755307 RepID=A0A2I8VME9_9EURY|nr:hypothetical protein [Salinigranum rubrum]AUV83103.1 hypothetical protein C2R22_16820 [Salinigranum rubrum]
MSPAVNYVRHPTRASSFNLTVARFLLGGYLVWTLLSFPWVVVSAWPIRHRSTHWTAVEPLLVAHLGLVLFSLSPNGGVKSLFVASVLLVGFGLYAGERARPGPVDRRARFGHAAGDDDGLSSLEPTPVPMHALRFALVVVAILYFGAGVDKAVHGPLLAWVAPRSLGSYLLLADVAFRPAHPLTAPLRALLLGAPLVLAAIAVATIALELGLLVADVGRLPVWPFVFGLFGMHVGIVVVMGPFFLDQPVFLSLFVAWDDAAGWLLSVLPSPLVRRIQATSELLGDLA